MNPSRYERALWWLTERPHIMMAVTAAITFGPALLIVLLVPAEVGVRLAGLLAALLVVALVYIEFAHSRARDMDRLRDIDQSIIARLNIDLDEARMNIGCLDVRVATLTESVARAEADQDRAKTALATALAKPGAFDVHVYLTDKSTRYVNVLTKPDDEYMSLPRRALTTRAGAMLVPVDQHTLDLRRYGFSALANAEKPEEFIEGAAHKIARAILGDVQVMPTSREPERA